MKRAVVSHGRPAAVLALLLAAPAAWAAGPSPQAVHQQERARCLDGTSHQDRATCLQEADAAQAEARRGSLGAVPAADLSRNATARCEAQPPADREDCVRRILGGGSSQGSVEGGGLIRQTERPVP